jgi:hypothetical protein
VAKGVGKIAESAGEALSGFVKEGIRKRFIIYQNVQSGTEETEIHIKDMEGRIKKLETDLKRKDGKAT